MNDKRIRVGLIGCGNAGRNIHMRLFRQHAALYEVVVCADAAPAAAEKLAADFGLRAGAEPERVWSDPAVELVVIATKPPETHHALALRALRAGKHVVVEKPMAATSAQGEEMVAAAAAAGRVLAVHHNRRWDVDFLTVRHAIESGAIGTPRLIRNEYTHGFAGSPYDWGIHLIDQTMALSFGKRFTEVTAMFAAPNAAAPAESEGFFSARLRTEDGVLHDVGMFPPFAGNAFRPGRLNWRFMAAGTAGVVYQEWCQRPEDAFMKPSAHVPADPAHRPPADPPVVAARLTVPDFYEMLHAAIRAGGPVPVSGAAGARAVRAWELIGQAAAGHATLRIDL